MCCQETAFDAVPGEGEMEKKGPVDRVEKGGADNPEVAGKEAPWAGTRAVEASRIEPDSVGRPDEDGAGAEAFLPLR
jgi:hypothetical protein